jgi:hypothetical protein
MTALAYLLFDTSEASDGTGLFDAMAAVHPAQAPDVQAEIDLVLRWAQAHFPDGPAPLDDGGDWDATWQVDDEADGQGTRRVFTLSIGGSAAFCAAFAEQFADALA